MLKRQLIWVELIMLSTSAVQRQFFTAAQQGVSEIAKPLFELTGLSYFSYAQDFHSKKGISLQSDNGPFNIWYKDQTPTCLRNIPEGVYLWDDVQNQNLVRNLREYGLENGIMIFKHFDTYSEIVSFTAPLNQMEPIKFYLNNVELVNKFVMHFKDKASRLIEKAKANAFDVPDYKLIFEERPIETKYNKFQDENDLFDIKHYNFSEKYNNIKLSRRELQCLKMFVKGMTSIQIAEELGLKKPSVDTFLLNLKKRFGCNRNSELMQIFWDLGVLKSNGVFF